MLMYFSRKKTLCTLVHQQSKVSWHLYTVKTFGLLQPYFVYLSCMPVVCETLYKLQKDASYLKQSLSVVEKLLLN